MKFKSAQARFTELMKEHFKFKPIICIEIGTASGLWTEHILRNYENILLYTIDPYKHFPGENYESGKKQDWHDYIRSVADKRLCKYPNLIRIFETSEKALLYLPQEVDVVYIDGNHNEEYIKFDVENYYPLVKKGGLFAGHDYNLPQVKKTVDEKFGDSLNVFKEQRIWWVCK